MRKEEILRMHNIIAKPALEYEVKGGYKEKKIRGE
jgi:hypothetical protein